jgi:putative ABC transport system permease protein
MLRAVGLSRAGLRATVAIEAGLYGVVGSALGLVLGVPYAWLTVYALDLGAPLVAPVAQLAAVVVVLAGLTILAGLLPARRAARVSPVAALAVE